MATLLSGWQQIRRSPGPLLLLHLLAAVRLLLLGARFWICFEITGLDGGFVAGLMFAAIISLLLVVNITPGSLGIREVVVGALGSMTGLSFAQTMLAASIDRVVLLAMTALLGAGGLTYLRTRLR